MKITHAIATLGALTFRTTACDLCSCELPLLQLQNRPGWHISAREQYTSFATLRQDGTRISDPAGQFLHSSNTQLILGYDFTKSFGVQLHAPFISRSFRRAESGRIETGHVAGLGDLSLLAHWTPLAVERGDLRFTARIATGLKLPTGDSSRLAEEGHESEGEGTPSGIHGHDLALGTGSVDALLGADAHLDWRHLFLQGGLQYTVRGQGSHDFDTANDLTWSAALGATVVKSDAFTLTVAARLSGDTKDQDYFRGQRLDDTSSTNVYVGPRFVALFGVKFSADLGFDFPIRQENSGVGSTPDWRMQAGASWQF